MKITDIGNEADDTIELTVFATSAITGKTAGFKVINGTSTYLNIVGSLTEAVEGQARAMGYIVEDIDSSKS